MSETSVSATPRAFISYSWSSPEHEQWVMELATRLVESGVDILLDKWDLREGQDAHAYMETMVTDPDVTKVIVVSDRLYAEKADKRAGGVGTESQIMSAEIYNKTDQTKFVAVIPEVDERGEPFLPRFFTSRVYILLTVSHYATNFEQLLRWLYNKPLYNKPALGQMPNFLQSDRPLSATRIQAKQIVEREAQQPSARTSISAQTSLNEYFDSLVNALESFRVDPGAPDFPQAVLDNIDAFLPYRNEFIEVLMAVGPHASPDLAVTLQRFFERIIPFMSRPNNVSSWRTWDYDNFVFLVHEMFLYAVAILLKYERFSALGTLIELRFLVVPDASSDENMQPYTVIWKPMEALTAKQEELRRTSLRADLLEQRSHSSGLRFREVMAADFVLFLRAASFGDDAYHAWFPETLLYTTFNFRGPFEPFARSESRAYFENLSPVLDIKNREQLEQLIATYSRNGENGRWLPRWRHHGLNLTGLSNVTRLQTRP